VTDGKKQVRQYKTCNLLRVVVHWQINLQLRFGEHLVFFYSPTPFWFPNSLDTAEAFYDMIYLLTAIGLSPGGSIHLHTNNTQNNTNNNRRTQITTNVEEFVLCWFKKIYVTFNTTLPEKAWKSYLKPVFRPKR
jgi:hypothetical protein